MKTKRLKNQQSTLFRPNGADILQQIRKNGKLTLAASRDGVTKIALGVPKKLFNFKFKF